MQAKKQWRGMLRFAAAGVLAVVLLMGLAGCATSGVNAPPTQGGDSDMSTASDERPMTSDLIRTGDRITVVFSGIPNPPPAHEETIGNNGQITPPLLNEPIQAANRTKGELQAELLRLYVPAFYKRLTITVENTQRYFSVGGYVANPGRFPYLSDTTLLTAIQAAGDATIWAWRGRVKISRADGRTTEEYDLDDIIKDPSLDPPIYPGDTVHVPKRPL